jgi:hypothetical protein
VSRLHIDDAQAAYAERDAVLRERPSIVRAAVRHEVRHPIEALGSDHLPRFSPHLHNSADPAHSATPSVCGARSLGPDRHSIIILASLPVFAPRTPAKARVRAFAGRWTPLPNLVPSISILEQTEPKRG